MQVVYLIESCRLCANAHKMGRGSKIEKGKRVAFNQYGCCNAAKCRRNGYV